MKRWRSNLYILMASQFLVMGAMSMIIPFLPLYLRELGMKEPGQLQFWAGIIFGINFLSGFIVAPIWGRLADRYGRKMMILRSGFGMGLIIFLTGLATSPLQLLILRFINGLVAGFLPASISLIVTGTPKEHIGFSLGLLQSGAVAGTIMGPLFGGILAEWIGFRWIFFLTSFLLIVASFVVFFFVKEEFSPTSEEKKNSFWVDGSLILHQRTLVILFTVVVLFQFAILGPLPQLSFFISSLEIPGGYIVFFAGLVAAVTGLSNILFAPLLGKLGDRYGSERILYSCMLAAAFIFIPHALVHSIWQLLILRFLLGICLGGIMPSVSSLIKKNSPKGKESMVFGYHTSALCLGNLLGPITFGSLSVLIGLRNIFFVTAVVLFMATICLKIGLKKRANIN